MPINTGLAHISNNLMYSAIAVYAVAMVLYAAELAFGRRGVVARTSGADAVRTATGSRSGSTSGAAIGANGAGAGAGTGNTTPERTTVGEGAGGSDSAGGRRRDASALGRNAVALTALGFALQVGALTTRGLSAHRVPWGNMYEFSSAAALAVTAAFLVLLSRWDIRYLGLFVMAPVVLTLGLAVTVLYTDSAALVPALHSYWLVIHVSAAVISSGVFTVGAAFSLLYLWREHAERRGTVDGRSLTSRLPAAAVLERNAYRVHAFAFPLWTFAVIAGAIWAENAWGRYWGWDPKETWAFITWVVYAAYLHARATGGWRGRRATAIALLGYTTFLFNYFAVNILFHGLHSYGGV